VALAPTNVEIRSRWRRHDDANQLPWWEENAGAVGLGLRDRRLGGVLENGAVEFVGLAPRIVQGECNGQGGRHAHEIGDEAKIFRSEADLLHLVAGGDKG